MKTLKDRLTINVLIVSVLFFVLLIGLNIHYFNRFGQDFVKTRLEHDIDSLLAALEPDAATGELTLDESRLNPIFLQPYSGHYFRITTDGRTYLSQSQWDYQIPSHHHRLGTIDLHLIPGPEKQTLLLLEGSYRKEGKDVWITVTEDYSPILDNLKQLGLLIGILGTVMILVLGLLQRWMVVRGLAPLTEAQRDLQRLDQGDVALLREDVPAEIRPLVREINQLLILADNRIKRSSTAIGNLAHSLKTPLAFLEHVLGKAKAPVSARDKEELHQALADIQYQLNSELRKARIIGAPTRGKRIPVGEQLAPLIDMLRKVYAEKALDFTVHIDEGAMFPGDSHDLMELMGNLLDNACKWARKTIALDIHQTDERLTIELCDDGPGGEGDVFDLLQKRGVRRDESGEGHGLGLSIVREIIDLYQADIDFSRAATGRDGLKITMRFSFAPTDKK